MVTICFIIGQLGKGGAEKQLYELSKSIDKSIYDVHIISFTNNGFWHEPIRKLNVSLHVIETNRKFFRLLYLFRKISEISPDLVNNYMFSANLYGTLASWMAGVKVIINSERGVGAVASDKTKLMLYIERFLSKYINAVICNSQQAADNLVANGFLKEKVVVIYNGLHLVNAAANSKIYGKIRIGTVGRLGVEKNHKLFIDVAANLHKKYSDIEFVIVGGGKEYESLKKYCLECDILSKVTFTGQINNVRPVIESFDVFLLTSLHEGMPNVIMEAMAYGVPVISTSVGGVPEIIQHNKTGILCPSENMSCLLEGIKRILQDDDFRNKIILNARKVIVEEFSVQTLSNQTTQLFNKLLEKY